MPTPLPLTTLELPAPAKLNLCLHINGRRPDGYHELQTLFQFLDYSDTLHFRLRPDAELQVLPELPNVPMQHNLVWRAANLLREQTDHPLPGVDITLDKRLPMGGGLGGGSSNAATTLLALNQLWQLNRPLEELAALGLQLGADVPVFVMGHAAWAEGVGEKLTPASPAEPWYLVLTPACNISTAKIFAAEGLTRDTPKIRMAPAFEAQSNAFQNDCQSTVLALHPEVREAMNWLNQFGNARLTGTGACVFASFDSKSSASRVLDSKPSDIKGFVAKGANLSTLHSRLYGL